MIRGDRVLHLFVYLPFSTCAVKLVPLITYLSRVRLARVGVRTLTSTGHVSRVCKQRFAIQHIVEEGHPVHGRNLVATVICIYLPL